jgi:hypothetical protein
MARVSHMEIPSWMRLGTKVDDDRRSSSARAAGSSGDRDSALKGKPDKRVINHPLRHQEE